jgi:diaminopimelate epimerase
MRLHFTKMSGAGNDFVLIDNRDGSVRLDAPEIARLCDRHFGVGADGVMLVEPPAAPAARYRMRYHNSDGGEAEMCGNGARCFARFVQSIDPGAGDSFAFETRAGLVQARIDGRLACVQLTPPGPIQPAVELTLASGVVTVHSCNTGVPHAVVFVDDTDAVPVAALGRELRRHAHFSPAGTNVNFAQVTGPASLRVRTYERGVEDETLACGTGVTAAALIAHAVRGLPAPVDVTVRGGDTLTVRFTRDGDSFRDVTLAGPADFVFTGMLDHPAGRPTPHL